MATFKVRKITRAHSCGAALGSCDCIVIHTAVVTVRNTDYFYNFLRDGDIKVGDIFNSLQDFYTV